ncbi:Na+-transporting NADH:ubiquinone oxidoreductase subunit C [Bathymodiolus platifrons methanotrophic gill symbiont]|uniref:Na(+)-translocating NADH-quinone reductase subunit C n=1 Tax=Bathymodiolus platifrons methanotrophic gill symbiont TaxID=113268 RepID=UPI000B413444|nr:Na(+)-translocating NADH-quinone reductase subunit C [Bathymodiolus platifrons methanotrophic gill symbiont]MCK5869302.1 Na(+)-translocating NADH-quinone reductase subunit C [Methyloprofundus sp.]TXK99235.1 Na(+)-translocating NADH-quinone reductase subunit C [Methylococcaceae bacterium CS4]TXL00171.1 Na(+)-translocating NADH-quinone reductase subunit C [Methylococcaceae bacterium CS5]TXL08421.1 Na(+)-translocating NADH-quinone reductase subunit C [Methylococcaceae bacterium CS1]TXL09395.1 
MPNENKICKFMGPLCEKLDNCEHYQKFAKYRDKVLALSNDSLEKTIAVALSLCFVCAILVSLAAVALRPLQIENKAMDMKKNILDVAGLLQEGTDIHTAFAEQIEAKLVDVATGDYVDGDIEAYDQRKAAKDPAQNVVLSRAQDIASIKKRAKIAKVYLVKDSETIKSIILPVHGYGLWSTMYGFLALDADGQTVQSINFYDQGETPGLGAEIVNPNWRALWKGKKVYSEDGTVALGLIKGLVDNSKAGSEFQVDGLAGATLTSVGVTNLVKFWMSQEGFSAYLDKVKTKG